MALHWKGWPFELVLVTIDFAHQDDNKAYVFVSFEEIPFILNPINDLRQINLQTMIDFEVHQ